MSMPLSDHEQAMGKMKRRFLIWTAAMLAFFCAVLGGVVYQIDRNATESCAATNKVIDTMVAYNQAVIAFAEEVPVDSFQARAIMLRRENNKLLEAARCFK